MPATRSDRRARLVRGESCLRRATATCRSLGLLSSLVLGCTPSVSGSGANPATPVASSLEPPDRDGLPQPAAASAWSPPSPGVWKLKSGARVLYRRHGAVPLVSLDLVIPRGAASDPPGKAGLTALMVDLLDEGAGTRSALELSERLKALATDYEVETGVDAVVLSMNLIADNFAESVDLLADIVRRPRLSSQEFERRKQQALAQALASEADPGMGRRVGVYRALFGRGYAGQLPGGTHDTLQRVTHADVKDHYRRLIVGEGVAFVVTGGIDRPVVKQHLERAFGDFVGEADVSPRDLSSASASGKMFLIDYPGAEQSALAVVRRAPGTDAEDYFTASVFNRSFGGTFMGRVNLNLRESKGYTYGAFSFFRRFRQSGYFGILSDVRSDATGASLKEIFSELRAVCGERPLSAAERDDSVSGMLLGYPGGFESISLVAQRLAELPINGWPLDWHETWPKRVATVTLEQANEAAATYCDRAEFSVVVAGDRARIADSLEELGLDRIELNARGQRL